MRRVGAAALLVGGLVLAGCGNGEDGPGEEPTADQPTTTAPATPDPTTPEGPTEPQEPAEPDEPEPPTGGEEPTGELPGEAVEIHPYEGGGLGVVGVAADDVLHVRAGPGVTYESIAELDPLLTDIAATGHNRSLANGSFWSQIVVGDVTGWASTAFLAYPGQTTDITAELTELPSAATVVQAAELVAEQRVGDQPPSATVVVVAGPREGDLHEVVLDVTGYGDDALGGERLHVFAAADEDGYTVRTVEATLLCLRGVSDGLCL